MSISECFEKAKKIAGKDKEFHGFALITNSCANDASPPNEDGMVYIKDSRSYFLGHADLIIGIKAPAEDEPLSCLDKEKFDSVRNNLYNHYLTFEELVNQFHHNIVMFLHLLQ